MITNKDCPLDITDEALIEQIKTNPDYFLCIMNRYEAKLKRYITRLGSFSPEEADDVLQEVFIKIYKNINDFDPQLKFNSWAYRIAHNHVVSVFRHNSARPVSWGAEPEDFANIKDEFDLAISIDDGLLRQQIERVIGELKPQYREVLYLKFLEEKSYEELSDILKKPMGTVATLIHKAKKEFKNKWSQAYE
ncbi:MAG: sigma-70 family RNA polymerase sigma factor [Candidatus Falkowbacteria bacterium]